MEITTNGQTYDLDEQAPQSAVSDLFRRTTEVAGLARLVNTERAVLEALPWPHYRDLVKAVIAAIYPFSATAG